MKKKYEEVEIDISLENYFILNEAARKKNVLLDEYVNEVIRKYIDEEDKKDKK